MFGRVANSTRQLNDPVLVISEMTKRTTFHPQHFIAASNINFVSSYKHTHTHKYTKYTLSLSFFLSVSYSCNHRIHNATKVHT